MGWSLKRAEPERQPADTLTVIDAFSSFPTVSVKQPNPSDDHGELLQLALFVLLTESQECGQLGLRENTLQGS